MINTAVIGYGYAGQSFHAYLVGLAEGLICMRLQHGVQKDSKPPHKRTPTRNSTRPLIRSLLTTT